MAKEHRVSLPPLNFLKNVVVSGIFLYNFLLVHSYQIILNYLDSVERIEHDPDNLHLEQELDGTLQMSTLEIHVLCIGRRILYAGVSEYLDG